MPHALQMAYQMGDIEVLLENGECKIFFRTMTQVSPSINKIIPVRRDIRSQLTSKTSTGYYRYNCHYIPFIIYNMNSL